MSIPDSELDKIIPQSVDNAVQYTIDYRNRLAESIINFIDDNNPNLTPFEIDFIETIQGKLRAYKEDAVFSEKQEIVMESIIQKYDIK